MMSMAQSIHSNIITLHDAVTDTLVYRAATLHFDQQLDAFTCWINDLAEQTKCYAEKLKQLNAETISLTNKLNPTAMVNDYLLDSKMTGLAATNYGDALKTNLSFKLKTVSDLEGNFTQPIQHFANQHIRDFKDFRERHKRALKTYEGALARYASLDGDHDDSTTSQLDQARKTYVEMSSEHVLRIIKLRHELEHFLIQQFSTATASRKEFFDDAQVWNQIDAILFSWTKWLAEDKRTSRSEIQKQQLAQQTLENEYLKGMQRKFGDIEQIKAPSTSHTKSGYLWIKVADDTSSHWIRQWFFVHNGYFGSSKVTNPEVNASITVDNCLSLRSCQAKHVDTSNRRFCFELISGQSFKSLFVLQAENQQELTEWMAAFRSKTTPPLSTSTSTETSCKHNRPSSIIISSYGSSNDQSRPRSPALLLAKSKSTTVVTTPVTLSTISSSNSSGFSNISILSSSPSGTMQSVLSRPHSVTAAATRHVKVTCSTPSSTPLLLREMTKGLPQIDTHQDEPLDSDKIWGTPRYVVSHNLGNHGNQQHIVDDNQETTATESKPLHDSDLPGYATYLDDKTQELRSLFYGVSDEEVVVEVFMASYLKRKPLSAVSNDQYSNRSSLMSLNSGYYYGGHVYVTQDTLWFYSKMSFNCITSVVLKLKDIEEIHVNHRTTKLTIDIVDGSDPTSPLVFSLLHDDVTAVAKKLRFLVYNAKLDTPMPLDSIHQRITAMSTPTPSLSSTISSTERSSLNDSPCSSFLTSHTKDTPLGLSSRMASSTTTTTMDTAETLITPNPDTMVSTAKNGPAINNKKAASKRFIDPDAIPDHITKPSEPVTCNCQDHLDRCEAQVELPISAKRLYELMFSDELTGPSTDGGVWNSKTEGLHARDLRVSCWECVDSQDSDGDDQQQERRPLTRVLKYWMPVANPIVRIKEAEVVETQTLLKKDDYICYVVQISTKTESLPFADAFIPSVRYCITYVNDSRCLLTCCLGVKWMKWIMAKMIVTRAAVSGMSDSINVFIPILNKEANTIQISVDNIRQSELNLAGMNVGENEHVDDDTDAKNDPSTTVTTTTSNQPMDTTHKSTPVTSKPTNRNRQLSNARPQPQNEHSSALTTTTPTNTSTTLYASSTTPITKRITATTLEISSTLKLKTTQLHRLIKSSVLHASCQKAPTLIKTTTGILWPLDVWTFGAIMIGCFVYVAAYLFTFSGATLNNAASPITQHQVVAHAVYLRDLDEGFIKNSLQPPYGESKSYKLFLKSRLDGQRYQWYDGRHYRLAQEYDTHREQLCILRHGVINLFQALNMADTYLLENEYLNWLLDYRQRCRHERKLVQQQTSEYNDSSSHLCDQINSQIGTYF